MAAVPAAGPSAVTTLTPPVTAPTTAATSRPSPASGTTTAASRPKCGWPRSLPSPPRSAWPCGCRRDGRPPRPTRRLSPAPPKRCGGLACDSTPATTDRRWRRPAPRSPTIRVTQMPPGSRARPSADSLSSTSCCARPARLSTPATAWRRPGCWPRPRSSPRETRGSPSVGAAARQPTSRGHRRPAPNRESSRRRGRRRPSEERPPHHPPPASRRPSHLGPGARSPPRRRRRPSMPIPGYSGTAGASRPGDHSSGGHAVRAGPAGGRASSGAARRGASAAARPAGRATQGDRRRGDPAGHRHLRAGNDSKDLTLFRSVRPSLSADEERRLRASFDQVDRAGHRHPNRVGGGHRRHGRCPAHAAGHHRARRPVANHQLEPDAAAGAARRRLGDRRTGTVTRTFTSAKEGR